MYLLSNLDQASPAYSQVALAIFRAFFRAYLESAVLRSHAAGHLALKHDRCMMHDRLERLAL